MYRKDNMICCGAVSICWILYEHQPRYCMLPGMVPFKKSLECIQQRCNEHAWCINAACIIFCSCFWLHYIQHNNIMYDTVIDGNCKLLKGKKTLLLVLVICLITRKNSKWLGRTLNDYIRTCTTSLQRYVQRAEHISSMCHFHSFS